MKNISPSLLRLSAVLYMVVDLRRIVGEVVGSGIVVLLVVTHLFSQLSSKLSDYRGDENKTTSFVSMLVLHLY